MTKKILVIDDEPDLMAVVTLRLKHSGYEIIPAVDAEEGLLQIRKDLPDLILLDLFLPKMQGGELCKRLKADEKYKNIPIIVFTASLGRPTLSESVKEMGADDCITKPFEAQILLGKVKKLIG